MIGAIAGDIIGSVYECRPIKTKDFPLFQNGCEFTDDTVLTVAVADAILSGRPYVESVRRIGRRYPGSGYGGSFIEWLHAEDVRPYNSWGNGSAMRVSPVGFAFSTEEEVLRHARMTAEITHNHPEGIKGDSDTLACITGGIAEAFYGGVPEEIRAKVKERLPADLWKITEAFCAKYR